MALHINLRSGERIEINGALVEARNNCRLTFLEQTEIVRQPTREPRPYKLRESTS